MPLWCAPAACIDQTFRSATHEKTSDTLEKFVGNDDGDRFSLSGCLGVMDLAHMAIVNDCFSLEELDKMLAALPLIHADNLRPTWDQYFMQLAELASHRSNCMKRRVGCVVVREKRVISTGYNGTPRGMTNCNEGGCKCWSAPRRRRSPNILPGARCNQASRAGISLDTCLCLHAEENALLEAGRDRIGVGSILYCNTCPCLTCSVKITQVGIAEVVYNQEYMLDDAVKTLFAASGVHLRRFSPPGKRIDLPTLMRADASH